MLRPAHRIDTGQAGRIRSARVGPTLVPAEASRTRMRRPPLVVVFVALLVIALGETAGAVISRSEERRVGKGVDLGGGRIMEKKKRMEKKRWVVRRIVRARDGWLTRAMC